MKVRRVELDGWCRPLHYYPHLRPGGTFRSLCDQWLLARSTQTESLDDASQLYRRWTRQIVHAVRAEVE